MIPNVPLWGGIKTVFFTFSKKTETPPPPFLTISVFSDKDFLDWPRPPSPKVSVEKSWRVLTLKFATFHQNGGFGDNSRP